MALRILVLGSGGREHALSWKLARSEIVARVFVCPGNGGTASAGEKISNIVLAAKSGGFAEIVAWAVDHRVREQRRASVQACWRSADRER
jgi:phosphoribosylamine--glycine ligase/phosphoribosylformylglycinamidine cyclo-ligase